MQIDNNCISIPSYIEWTETDGEIVVLQADTNMFYGFNDVGAIIWKGIAEGLSTSELVCIISNQYQVDPGDCSKYIDEFAVSLHEKQLVAFDNVTNQ